MLWHEAIAGRNDEHVSSAYVKLITSPRYVRETMSEHGRNTTIVEEDLPGLRVRIHLPAWMKVFVQKDHIVRLITIHHPSLTTASFNQYQPVKSLDNGATLIYFSLDYKAQMYFARLNWKITLLGSTLAICDPGPRQKRESSS